MTSFPTLTPSTRTYSPGEFPSTAHPLLSGSEVRVRHSNTVLGVRMRLTFAAASSDDILAVRNHYNGRRGGFLPFAIPVDLLSGVFTPDDFTPAGHQWVYVARPQVVDVPIEGPTPMNRHDLVVELQTVPPENTIVAGARIASSSILRTGSAQLGTYIGSSSTLQAGAASVFTPGLAPGASIASTSSLTAGAASAVTTDPGFASISLLLPLNGTNGGTTFTDASVNGFTVTANGNAQTSTAQSKWGGSSLLLDGSGDYLSVASDADFNFGTSDFTVEAWVYLTSVTGNWFIASSSGSGGLFFGYSTTEVPAGWGCGRTAIAWDHLSAWTASTSTWYHVALCRSGTSLRLFTDGVQRGATSTNSQSYNISTTSLTIGSQGAGLYMSGYMNDLRITKGVARYTADFTAPTGPFPTS